VEGVMMRGQDHWAVAVREPAGDIYVESHDVDSLAARQKIWRGAVSSAGSSSSAVAADRYPGADDRVEPRDRRGRGAHVDADPASR
jgi:uncharacterized protein YqhQ